MRDGAWDVLVVGAGPAGALTAGLAARRGLSTLLVERSAFPRWKVCGACLNPAGVAVLRWAGLGGILQGTGGGGPDRGAVPLEGLRLRGWGDQAIIPLRGSVAFSRRALDQGLRDAALEWGAVLKTASAADAGAGALGARRLTLRTAAGVEEVRARVVVDAAGLAGMRRAASAAGGGSRVGVGAVFPPEAGELAAGWIDMFASEPGYVGLVRQEDGTLDVAGALDPGWIRRHGDPGSAVKAHLERAGGVPPRGEPLEGWRGTPPLTWRPASVAEDRLFRVGDAAGYVEPFTGEGMAWALGGAALLGPLLDEAVRGWSPGLAARWARLHAREIVRRQRICRSVAWLSRHPYLSRGAVRWSGRLPRVASLTAGALARPFPLPGYPGGDASP